MIKQMAELRDRFAEKWADDTDVSPSHRGHTLFDFTHGFNACYAEMAPLIEVLERIGAGMPESILDDERAMTTHGVNRGQWAREALKKIGAPNV